MTIVSSRLTPSWLAYNRWRTGFVTQLDRRFYTPEWLDEQVWNDEIRCWDETGGAILAAIRIYPTGAKEVHGMAAVGCLAAIQNLIPLAEQWGLQHNAIVASIASRAGWSRALRDCGYTPHQVEIRKELSVGPVE